MSTELPHLSTPRLLLRALEPDQAEILSTLANGPKIADNTANIPVPYTLETAQLFIAGSAEKYRAGELLSLGMHVQATGELIGIVSLRINSRHHYGHLGGWVAAHCRNQGYAAEAASAVTDFGFVELGLQRVGSQCFGRNQESARVMEKIGLRYEGCLRQAFLKNGVYEDLLGFATVRDDWERRL
ncbi:GNAT family N-acetyltransferase [Pseudomonas sp. R11F]|uniref:N-acetyltransferase n=1 Tax=Pseudomonas palleroniana TaxID=191390 RepID=A0A1H5FP34_9PSED|nr:MULTISPECIES: GNAT family protein [Pseudomonas]KAB0563804.1 GNAT family N-acetyltransferase [Pseudomonas palleroniana]MBM9489375.1 GNAT family N-acetyltransferase [Pseudomonas sp. ICBG1301]NCE88392.1 N-acetyltransferase [Pseudomonas sp. Q1]PTC21921.1 N-acetyltransferase [Pseudomonas palleroniana]UOK36989.1 GNAT family N-acetyltransferase [Pseudomonas palleroniana]